jgi:hypothetical protein
MTDYQEFTTKNTSKEQRRKLNIGDIWSNQAKCLKCGDIIRSKNRHDYVECKCGAIAVDGGSWYLRRTGKEEDIEEMSEMYNGI